MIKLNKDTKKAKNWLDAEVEGYKLGDVYGSYSSSKGGAFERCTELCKDKNGRGLCIIGHNSSYFTVKFNVDSGVYVITYANIYFIEN